MEKLLLTIEFIKSNLLPIATLFTSIATFLITFRNHWETRTRLEVIQLGRQKTSILIKPDRTDAETPDVYWDAEYRVLSEVIITNKSSKPISIIEFQLNNKYSFNSYTAPGECYTITLQPSRIKDDNGVTSCLGTSKTISFTLKDFWLQPVLTIPPHTSIRGYLFFNLRNDHSDVQLGKNELSVLTSRKTIKYPLTIYKEYLSLLPPEEQFSQDASQIDF